MANLKQKVELFGLLPAQEKEEAANPDEQKASGNGSGPIIWGLEEARLYNNRISGTLRQAPPSLRQPPASPP